MRCARETFSGKDVTIDLFRQAHEANLKKAQPLAARMRPRTRDETGTTWP